MNGTHAPPPVRIRILTAGGAVLATATVMWVVLALASHYDDEFLQASHAQAATALPTSNVPAAAGPASARQG